MIVMKFGGTSVQDAAAINQVVEIVSARLDSRPVVVVSAMAGVTDALLQIARMAKNRQFEQASGVIQIHRAQTKCRGDKGCRRARTIARRLSDRDP